MPINSVLISINFSLIWF